MSKTAVESPQHLVATLNDYRPSELVGHITARDAAIRAAAIRECVATADSAFIACHEDNIAGERMARLIRDRILALMEKP